MLRKQLPSRFPEKQGKGGRLGAPKYYRKRVFRPHVFSTVPPCLGAILGGQGGSRGTLWGVLHLCNFLLAGFGQLLGRSPGFVSAHGVFGLSKISDLCFIS